MALRCPVMTPVLLPGVLAAQENRADGDNGCYSAARFRSRSLRAPVTPHPALTWRILLPGTSICIDHIPLSEIESVSLVDPGPTSSSPPATTPSGSIYPTVRHAMRGADLGDVATRLLVSRKLAFYTQPKFNWRPWSKLGRKKRESIGGSIRASCCAFDIGAYMLTSLLRRLGRRGSECGDALGLSAFQVSASACAVRYPVLTSHTQANFMQGQMSVLGEVSHRLRYLPSCARRYICS
eukprot:633905-Rhodomonas_salina.1